MRKSIFFIFLILSLINLSGQNFQFSNEIKVIKTNGDTLFSAWGGGMNAPQFGQMDFNLDGKKDIVIFDRADWQFTPYLNVSQPGESKYRYAPEFKTIFDTCQCAAWASFVDYNCDGNEDIFCGTTSSLVKVFTQIPIGNDSVGFRQDYMAGFFGVLHTQYGFGYSELFSTITDIPAILDADFDGDTDFLTFGSSSNYVELHKNLAMENFGRCDTLVLFNETVCWGHFSENSSDNSAIIHDTLMGGCQLNGFHPNFRTPEPQEERHAGSTMLGLDLNGNNLIDMLIGDISFKDIYALYNNAGIATHAYIDSVQTNFPQYDVPVNLSYFPGIFYLDVNNNGVKDMVLAPNLRDGSENYHAVQVYNNNTVDNNPVFKFSGKGFLQDENIELGTNANPLFFDHNNDGKMDILVGNFGYFEPSDEKFYSGLALLENTGSVDVPAYTIHTDYLSFLADTTYPNLRNIYPALGDLDGDGDKDMLLGNSLGDLYYYRNDGGTGVADFQFVGTKYQFIDVGNNSAPVLYDIDNDQDMDLFIGNDAGRIWYYKNSGSQTTAVFDTVTSFWGKIKVGNPGTSGNAKPFIVDYDKDGQMELLLGTFHGGIEIYENLPANATDTLTYDGLLFNRDFGAFTAVAAAEIDSTQELAYLIGNYKGGLMLYKEPLVPADTGSVSIAPKSDPVFAMYPNPAEDKLSIDLFQHSLKEKKVEIFNLLGQLRFTQTFFTDSFDISLAGFQEGMYFIRIETSEGVETQRLIVHNKK